MVDPYLNKMVTLELEHAHENGYLFEGWTALEIAGDMCTYAHFEDREPETLVPYIEHWFKYSGVTYQPITK